MERKSEPPTWMWSWSTYLYAEQIAADRPDEARCLLEDSGRAPRSATARPANELLVGVMIELMILHMTSAENHAAGNPGQ